MLSHALGMLLTPPFLQSSHGTLIILAIKLGKQVIRNPELPDKMIPSGHSASWSGSSIWQSSTCWQNTLFGRRKTLLPLFSSQMECLSYLLESLRNFFFLYTSITAPHHQPSTLKRYISISWWILTSWGAVCHGAVCHRYCLKSPMWNHLAKIVQWFESYGPAHWKSRGRCCYQKAPLPGVVMTLVMTLMETPSLC